MKRDVTNIYYYINITSDQYHSYIPGMWFFRVPLIIALFNCLEKNAWLTSTGIPLDNITPGRLMKTTAVVFIREGDRQKDRDFPHWFMWEIAIFQSSEFAYTQFMTPTVRYQSHGRVRWVFIEKLVIEISRWWRPLEMGMKTTDCVAGDLMKTTVVN